MERKESIGEEATSKKTVEDLEEDDELTAELDDKNVPSPDGAFDQSDELKKADPV